MQTEGTHGGIGSPGQTEMVKASQEPGLVTDDKFCYRPSKGLIVGRQPSQLSQGLGQVCFGDGARWLTEGLEQLPCSPRI